MKFLTLLLWGCLFTLWCLPTNAMHHKKKGKKMMQAKAPYEYYEERGLFETGLKPIFPKEVTCARVASYFGSKTRYDGSKRNNSHHGYHNGMDISLQQGHHLLAMSDGEVVHKGSAGKLVGNYIWLKFSPNDSGMSQTIFARYQHLQRASPLEIGQRVKKGDIIGRSGKTGTIGGYFGSHGYPHLHLNLLVSQDGKYQTKGAMLGPKSMHYLDPIGLFVNTPLKSLDNHQLRQLPTEQKNVAIAVKTQFQFLPKEAKIIWPVTCPE
ncbi:exported hypothetical protein [Candidatus Terasakiella magnetica]|uniref:M23ase beta-sheet core domain-containing protein n=1 Tax=Candidatus Terasakiella magnetica TaxID=1867952 RepID=A0A1C3RG05_9PROT|nr:M23 family metallopeptidase [Candidatus Terasakiella magnetica]SCA56189.1 exported hypothetical protein [Candidatus Terasakiella magnetica]